MLICLIRTLHSGFKGGRVWSQSKKRSDGTHGATFEHMWDLKLLKSTHSVLPDTCRLSPADMKVIRKDLNDQQSQFQIPQKFIVFTCLLASQTLGKPSKRCQGLITNHIWVLSWGLHSAFCNVHQSKFRADPRAADEGHEGECCAEKKVGNVLYQPACQVFPPLTDSHLSLHAHF